MIPTVLLVGALSLTNHTMVNITPEQTEELVEYYFPDVPEMVDIARCESRLKQYTNGSPTRSHTNDYGLFQVNEASWKNTADTLGVDFKTLGGNIVMARYILMTQGLGAWKASSHCWK